MGPFFDLHSHMLCGVDDGAKDQEEMLAMLEEAYADGIRAICLTPHFSPYLFGDTYESSAQAFDELCALAARLHPDMQFFLGHELGYYSAALSALESGHCRTLAGSRYVLVDFPETVSFFELTGALERLQCAGYKVILAHAERYRCLYSKFSWIENFVDLGGLIQLNASSCTGVWGSGAARQWKKLIRKRLAHVIATDAHNLHTRAPRMSVCMDYLQKKCDEEAIAQLVWENPWRIVNDLPI